MIVLFSVHVELPGSKITINSAKKPDLKTFLYGLSAVKVGFMS